MLLAEKMGGKGEYAVFVGSLTVPLHNAWADAALNTCKKNHPEMTLVGDRYVPRRGCGQEPLDGFST